MLRVALSECITQCKDQASVSEPGLYLVSDDCDIFDPAIWQRDYLGVQYLEIVEQWNCAASSCIIIVDSLLWVHKLLDLLFQFFCTERFDDFDIMATDISAHCCCGG